MGVRWRNGRAGHRRKIFLVVPPRRRLVQLVQGELGREVRDRGTSRSSANLQADPSTTASTTEEYFLPMSTRTKIRVDFGDEVSWAEHVSGDVYRSLNDTLSNVLIDLPHDHPHAAKNGQEARMRWGHLFRAEKLPNGRVRPLALIGLDRTKYD